MRWVLQTIEYTYRAQDGTQRVKVTHARGNDATEAGTRATREIKLVEDARTIHLRRRKQRMVAQRELGGGGSSSRALGAQQAKRRKGGLGAYKNQRSDDAKRKKLAVLKKQRSGQLSLASVMSSRAASRAGSRAGSPMSSRGNSRNTSRAGSRAGSPTNFGGADRLCSVCGQPGHMSTSKMCPLFNAQLGHALAVNSELLQDNDAVKLRKGGSLKLSFNSTKLKQQVAASKRKKGTMLKLGNLKEKEAAGRRKKEQQAAKRLAAEKDRARKEEQKRKRNSRTNRGRRYDPLFTINNTLEHCIDDALRIEYVKGYFSSAVTKRDKFYQGYMAKIKNPIDLGTMRMKCTQQKYERLSEFEDDMRLLAENAATFNGASSHVAVTATTMLKASLAANADGTENRRVILEAEAALRAQYFSIAPTHSRAGSRAGTPRAGAKRPRLGGAFSSSSNVSTTSSSPAAGIISLSAPAVSSTAEAGGGAMPPASAAALPPPNNAVAATTTLGLGGTAALLAGVAATLSASSANAAAGGAPSAQ
jgi:hypothetical protein